MAQTNFTPILLYASSTPTNVPSAGNLTNSTNGSEIAINIADKNLFFKDSGGAVNTVPIRQSSTSSNGWLSSTDWNTFNNKSNTNGTVTSVAALTLGTTGTDLSSTVANGTTTPVITLNVPTASAANRGALSAADWSTFNGKQAALVSGTNIKTVGGITLLGSGDLGTIGVGYGGTGTSTAFTSGSIVFAGASGVYSQDNASLFWDDTNNRLGVGTASPAYKIHASGAGAIGIIAQSTSASGATMSMYGSDGAQGFIGTLSNHVVTFATNSTEKMRLDTSGNFLVGGTSMVNAGKALVQWNSAAGVEGLILYDTDSTAVGRFAQKFNRNGSVVGSIQTTLTATSYVTSSDYRLKENIAPMIAALDTVAKLKPVTYTWKIDGSSGQGFIAHELQEIMPECVTGKKDGVSIIKEKDENGKVISTKEIPSYQGIDTSFLVATLTAAIQELNDKFDAYVASHP